MTTTLIKHGSEAGYREEIKLGDACTRCRNGHREFDRQYSKPYRAKGLKYTRGQVIDHLYTPGKTRGKPAYATARPATPRQVPASAPEVNGDSPVQSSLGNRLSDALAGAVGRSGVLGDNPYVTTEERPEYLSDIEPDPEPDDSDFGPEPDAEYILNAAGLEKIEENLGTYLSIVGMTAEMIDPYCGSILAENFDNIVKRWTKVIAHYPKAAELFLDGKGGVIMNWIGALQATWPVLLAVYHHHLARDIQVKDGRVFRRDGAVRNVDPTMPPMPDDFNYSAT